MQPFKHDDIPFRSSACIPTNSSSEVLLSILSFGVLVLIQPITASSHHLRIPAASLESDNKVVIYVVIYFIVTGVVQTGLFQTNMYHPTNAL